MDKDTPQAKGWKSWKFNFGTMSVEVTTSKDSQLEQDLINHIDELAYGGWSIRHPTLDEIDKL